MVVGRDKEVEAVTRRLRAGPVVAILGARQVGKTTLAMTVAERMGRPVRRFDLENPDHVTRLADPMLALEPLRGLVVIDEIQRRPELFPALRVLADRPRKPARFLLLGSASPRLLRQSSESLAGRIAFHELGGFSLAEVGNSRADRLWLRGGFPRAFLSAREEGSREWRRDFVRTFLERDLPELGVGIASTTMRRFWTMVAHYHGQIWNSSELARAFGVSDMTVRRYLDVLAGTFVVRVLPSWAENLGKRQVKSPKVFLRDSGLLHTLLGIASRDDLEGHPKVGASWEGFGVETIIRHLGAEPDECFSWATHAGAELDLLVVRGRTRLGFDFKRTTAPAATRSMHVAVEDLKLDRLDVVHAGRETYPLSKGIRAVAMSRVLQNIERL
jgi:hypothetical protein